MYLGYNYIGYDKIIWYMIGHNIWHDMIYVDTWLFEANRDSSIKSTGKTIRPPDLEAQSSAFWNIYAVYHLQWRLKSLYLRRLAWTIHKHWRHNINDCGIPCAIGRVWFPIGCLDPRVPHRQRRSQRCRRSASRRWASFWHWLTHGQENLELHGPEGTWTGFARS